MKTNCKEVFEETPNCFSIAEYITVESAERLIAEGNPNVVCGEPGDSQFFLPIEDFIDGMEYALIRYFEYHDDNV